MDVKIRYVRFFLSLSLFFPHKKKKGGGEERGGKGEARGKAVNDFLSKAQLAVLNP